MVRDVDKLGRFGVLPRIQRDDVRIGDSTGDVMTGRVVRHYRLVNRCSQRHVLMTSRHVNAKASYDDIYADLRITSESFGSYLRIQSARTSSFLCFNKIGRLVVKVSGARDSRCVFQEVLTPDSYSEFRSAFDATWFVAFGRQGQRLHGSAWSDDPSTAPRDRLGQVHRPNRKSLDLCRRFVKLPSRRLQHSQSSSSSSSSFDSSFDRLPGKQPEVIGNINFERLFARWKTNQDAAATATAMATTTTRSVAEHGLVSSRRQPTA